MRNLFITAGIAALLIAGLFYIRGSDTKTSFSSPTPQPTNRSSDSEQSDIEETSVIAENLDTPWGMAFLPDGSMLVTERPGRVRLINSNGLLQSSPVATLEAVREIGEGGLLGIAIHPDFSSNNYVYLYYTYSGSGNDTLNRVVRMTYKNGSLSNEKIIVDKIPGASNHNGGRIKFGPASPARGESDKLLYITTGDAQEPSLAQDKNSLAGKILRVSDDDKAALDNPFGNLVYSYGHRNSQGLAWDKNKALWATEHGRSGLQSGLDELNLIEAGKNYGWPTIQGEETRQGMQTARLNSGSTTWAPAGAAFLPAARQGIGDSLFFAGLRGQTLYEAIIQDGQVTNLKEHFKGEFGRLRDVVVGPDNLLYISTSNQDGRGSPQPADDKILRVNPDKL